MHKQPKRGCDLTVEVVCAGRCQLVLTMTRRGVISSDAGHQRELRLVLTVALRVTSSDAGRRDQTGGTHNQEVKLHNPFDLGRSKIEGLWAEGPRCKISRAIQVEEDLIQVEEVL